MFDLDNLFRLDHYVGPRPLSELCLQVICKNLDLISVKDEYGNRHLLKDVVLPHEICDKLFIEYFEINPAANPNNFFTIFQDTRYTKLKHVKVGPLIPDSLFRILTSHKLAKLEFTCCPIIRKSYIENINRNAENLYTLIFRKSVGSIPVTLTEYYERGYVFKVPNLRILTLEYARICASKYKILLNGLTNLTHLDLSYSFDVGTFDFYTEVPNLISLVLYNVKITSQAEAFVNNICNLKKLRHLDISQIHLQDGIFTNPTKLLSEIINGLPQLTSLDISGTNLAGTKVDDCGNQLSESSERYNNTVCDIPGLASRINRPLEFLGLYGVFTDTPCTQNNIPAKLIAGTANEDQILVAVHVYMNSKEDLMSNVISDLYHMYRYENCHRMDQALCAVLEAMEKYPTQEDIQIPGSAALFYIVKMKKNDKLDTKLKKRIVGTLLTGMSIHRDQQCMMRNGCLTLYQFRLPQDVRSHYELLVKLLLYLVERTAHESYVQRIGIFLLNTLACKVTGREKRLLGNLGCIKILLELIRYRVESEIYDYVMEIAWSTLWNVTDETPINCQRFFDENGMLLFYRCVVYSQKEELLKNMLGLLGNLAEVRGLRVHLMHPPYMSVFTCLMRTVGLSIEIPYNAVGILAHIASDGVEAWKSLIGIEKFNRDDVLELMAEAIERWDISSERNINYRSFEPLLRLVDVYHTPQCQHWAVWALANLTTVYPDKYCMLLIREGGYEKLETLISHPRPYERIKELARIVIENCDNYTGKNFVKSFINEDSIYSSDGSDVEN
ncbi:protein zer-1 homolog isoform X2 [Ceratina calcarata]|uniref:Protein zer-1 homolog isoform X2 n=1 Tax=Ceratina calcarata TaxID=156304 RepID=A0AAJ7JHV2_9HYME|nr:protein zer-1 homolog isoform X2 [Ceratina calcarata]